jgi:hypothetical protein
MCRKRIRNVHDTRKPAAGFRRNAEIVVDLHRGGRGGRDAPDREEPRADICVLHAEQLSERYSV